MRRFILCILSIGLLGPGCDVATPPPEADQSATERMPARIDAMMTSRFKIIRDGPLVARGTESLMTVADLAELDPPPFLRLLDSMQPSAFSNGGSIIYLTRGSVLLANDAQLFMMIAHEAAHLEAKNLSSTQYEKAVIRATEATLSDVREDPTVSCDDDPGGDAFNQDPFEEEEDDDREFWQVLAGDILCSAAQGAVSAAVEGSLEAERSEALQRWSQIEGEMDKRAFALGREAGHDQAELMSVFSLLHRNASGVPFLVERTRRLSSIPGIDRVSIQVPPGRHPIELAGRLGGEALEVLHDLGRNTRIGPEIRFRSIQAQAAELLPVYGESDTFLRGYYGYLLAYGGLVGIDPAPAARGPSTVWPRCPNRQTGSSGTSGSDARQSVCDHL